MRRHASSSYPFGLPDSLPFLFNGGEEGAIYDPSILSSLYQDSAKTTPVAAYGDPVGAIEDQTGNGNDALQATSGPRPLYARMPKTGINNDLQYTEQFDNAYWTKFQSAITANADGIYDKLREDSATAVHNIFETTATVVSGQAYTFYVDVKPDEYDWVQLTFAAAQFGSTFWANFDVTNGVVGNTGAGITSATIAVSPDDPAAYRCTIIATATASGAAGATVSLTDNTDAASRNLSYAGDGSSGILIGRAQLDQASSAGNYQKVVSAYDVTESGIEDVFSIKRDNTDDFMSCDINTVDLSGAWEAVQAVYFSTAPTSQTVFTLSNALSSATEWAGIAIDSSSRPIVTTNGKTSSTGTAITAGFYIFRLRWDGTQFKLFVNGVLDITETPSSAITWSGVDYIVLGAVLDATPQYTSSWDCGGMLIVRNLSDAEASNVDRFYSGKTGASL